MEVENENRAKETFRSTILIREKCVQVVLQAGFNDLDWEGLERFYQPQIEKGLVFWDLDLRKLTMLNSQLLGLLVGLNADLMRAGGQLRLIVAEDSPINQLLTISKIRRIMSVLMA